MQGSTHALQTLLKHGAIAEFAVKSCRHDFLFPNLETQRRQW
jgi:hypothetical protein